MGGIAHFRLGANSKNARIDCKLVGRVTPYAPFGCIETAARAERRASKLLFVTHS
jgi:hypothetical protein